MERHTTDVKINVPNRFGAGVGVLAYIAASFWTLEVAKREGGVDVLDAAGASRERERERYRRCLLE